jgi:hypothetical protein
MRPFLLAASLAVAAALPMTASAEPTIIEDATLEDVRELAGPPTLFLIASGNRSCPEPMDPSVNAMFRRLEPFLGNNEYILTCYGWRMFRYMTDTSNYEYGEIRGNNNSRINTTMKALIADRAPTRMVVMGHSYGAWQTLKLLEGLSVDEVFFVSLDAVSPKECSILMFWDCRGAPEDIDYAAVGANVDLWINIYQDKDVLVQSGEIAEATLNLNIGNNHGRLRYDEEVWHTVYNQLVAQGYPIMDEDLIYEPDTPSVTEDTPTSKHDSHEYLFGHDELTEDPSNEDR